MKRFPHIPAQPVPCNLTVFKGVKAGAFTREFVGFVITDPFAIHYYNWIYDTGHPEEHFVSTLATLSAVRAGRKKGWKVVQRFDLGVLGKKDNFMVDYTG